MSTCCPRYDARTMARNLPPLNPLRAFEVAARHTSFTKAAEELFVTPSAVSHQVRTLEEHLGMALFIREAKALTLTAAGRAYLPAVQEAFQVLAHATRQLSAELAPVLRVDIPPTFAVKWLIPRLDRFVKAYPEIDIRVSTNSGPPDFARDNYDVAIRFGRGYYPDLHSELCLKVDVFPVCSPQLMQGAHPLREPSDLKHHTLLHDASTYTDGRNPHWSDWLKHAGAVDVDASRGLSFTPSHLVIDSAIDGLGVALVKDSWVERDLLQGKLVRPFDIALPVESAYYMVFPKDRTGDVRIATFVDWVRAEGAATAPQEC
jgi:LysR family glycine cleavage system transcriptional activator